MNINIITNNKCCLKIDVIGNYQLSLNSVSGMFNIVFKTIGVIIVLLGLLLYFNINSMFGNTMTNIEEFQADIAYNKQHPVFAPYDDDMLGQRFSGGFEKTVEETATIIRDGSLTTEIIIHLIYKPISFMYATRYHLIILFTSGLKKVSMI